MKRTLLWKRARRGSQSYTLSFKYYSKVDERSLYTYQVTLPQHKYFNH